MSFFHWVSLLVNISVLFLMSIYFMKIIMSIPKRINPKNTIMVVSLSGVISYDDKKIVDFVS